MNDNHRYIRALRTRLEQLNTMRYTEKLTEHVAARVDAEITRLTAVLERFGGTTPTTL